METLWYDFTGYFINKGLWEMLLVVLVFFVVSKIISKVLLRRNRRIRATGNRMLVALVDALAHSVVYFGVVIGLIVGEQFLDMGVDTSEVLRTVNHVLMLFSIAWVIYLLIDVPSIWFEIRLEKSDSRMNTMFVPIVRKSLRLILILLVFVQLIQILSQKPITSVIAGLGLGGLAVALAAQDTLRHFIGSFVLAGDKPFELDERIVVDGHDGMVESIGLRSTRIRTLDGHLVTIPNGELANRTIQNIGRRKHIRRLMSVSLTYDTPPEKMTEAVEIVKSLLENHEGMHADFPPRVYFSELGSDSLNLMVIYWYHPPSYWDYMAFNERFNFDLLNRFNAAGIEFAFPSQTLYLAGDKNRPVLFNPLS